MKPDEVDLNELEARDRLIIAGNVEKEGFGHDQFVNIYDEVKLRQFIADKVTELEKNINKDILMSNIDKGQVKQQINKTFGSKE